MIPNMGSGSLRAMEQALLALNKKRHRRATQLSRCTGSNKPIYSQFHNFRCRTCGFALRVFSSTAEMPFFDDWLYFGQRMRRN